MKKYKILWIDDEYELLAPLMKRCELMHGFEITKCRFAEEGMKIFEQRLEEWSAVILDAKMLVKSVDEMTKLDGLRLCRDKIHELRPKRYVPSFVFTGQPGLMSNEMFEEMVGKYYKKGDDDDLLIEDVKCEANRLVETQVRQKYSDVLALWPDMENELVNILKIVEIDDTSNGHCLNDIRKVLEGIMETFHDIGLLQIDFNTTNLSECSRFLGQNYMCEIIPLYVQRSIHSCVAVTNPGSHRTKLYLDIKKGRVPYVLKSTIFELLNILEWYKNLPVDKTLIKDGIALLVSRNTSS